MASYTPYGGHSNPNTVPSAQALEQVRGRDHGGDTDPNEIRRRTASGNHPSAPGTPSNYGIAPAPATHQGNTPVYNTYSPTPSSVPQIQSPSSHPGSPQSHSSYGNQMPPYSTTTYSQPGNGHPLMGGPQQQANPYGNDSSAFASPPQPQAYNSTQDVPKKTVSRRLHDWMMDLGSNERRR